MDWDITISIPDLPLSPDPSRQDSYCPSLLRTTSTLSIICARIMVSLYGQRRQRTATQLHSLASQMHKDLWQWYQDLPAELVLADHDENKISAPEVFILQLVSLHPAMP